MPALAVKRKEILQPCPPHAGGNATPPRPAAAQLKALAQDRDAACERMADLSCQLGRSEQQVDRLIAALRRIASDSLSAADCAQVAESALTQHQPRGVAAVPFLVPPP